MMARRRSLLGVVWGYLLGVALSSTPNLVAATEVVLEPDPSDPTKTKGDAASIQAALDDAVDGDVITLLHGTYLVNLNFPRKAITLRGDPDATQDEVILDGSGCVRPEGTSECSVIVFDWIEPIDSDSAAKLMGITIQGGAGRTFDNGESSQANGGGGVWMQHGDVEIDHVTISGNSAISGGGMYLASSSSSPTLTHVTISGNSAVNYGGGGGMALCGSDPVLTHVILSDNSAYYGGGMALYCFSSPTLTQVTISGNSAIYDGGGMLMLQSDPTLTQVTISGNSADSGGGGGMYIYESDPLLTQVTLSGNSANYGGGMWLYSSSSSSSSPTLTHVTISGNSAIYDGGGVFLIDSSPTFHNSIIANNSAGGVGATLYRHQSTELSPTITNTILYPATPFSHIFNYTALPPPFDQAPLFLCEYTDGSCLEGDYRLHPNSPAIGIGATSGCYNPSTGAFDQDCIDPDGSAPDLGAWGGPGAADWDMDWDDAPAMWWPVYSDGTPVVAEGYAVEHFDCDDHDPSVYPGADDIPYDGIDQDCDGSDLTDVDADGISIGEDCDDTNPTIHPAADDIPYDGIDQDCDGSDLSDVDGDGFSYGEDGTDCDDTNVDIHPGAEDPANDGVDQDCSEGDRTDEDDDGHLAQSAGGGDCDDTNPDINPTADDIPYDGIDQDCDGFDLTDVDGDGFSGGADCNEENSGISPGTVEICDDGVDNDCDPTTPDTCGRRIGCACDGGAGSHSAQFHLALLVLIPLLRRRRLGQAGWVLGVTLIIASASAGDGPRGLNRAEDVPGVAASGEAPRYSGKFALLIGMSDYRDAAWKDLRGVKGELDAVKRALEGLGFEVVPALDLGKDELRNEVEGFIRKYGTTLSHQLLIFYAGHGYSMDTDGKEGVASKEGYIVPVNAPSPTTSPDDFRFDAVRMSEVKSWLALSKTQHMLLVFDSCFAGTIFTDMRSSYAGRLDEGARHIITAGDFNQQVPDQSVFGDLLVGALEHPERVDPMPDGILTCRELGNYLAVAVPQSGLTNQQPQSGPLRDPKFEYGDCEVARYQPSRYSCGNLDTCLAGMRADFAQAVELDRRGKATPEARVRSWEGFELKWQEDLPGTEDDALHIQARARLAQAREDVRTGGVEWCQVGPIQVTCSDITAAQYERCEAEGVCTNLATQEGRTGCTAAVPGRGHWAINCLDAESARAYARWLGGTLPTREQWILLAGSPPDECEGAKFALEGDLGPVGWGCGRRGGSPAPVVEGPEPALAGLWGGVWEWIRMEDESFAIAGGAWDVPLSDSAASPIRQVDPGLSLETVGMRVVRPSQGR